MTMVAHRATMSFGLMYTTVKWRIAKVQMRVGAEVHRTGGGQGHTSVVIGTWDGVWIELHRTELGLGT